MRGYLLGGRSSEADGRSNVNPVGAEHERFMRRAIELSREGMRDGCGGPFAAVVVKDGRIVGEGTNRVTSGNDPTAHAEVVAIRQACTELGTYSLEGADIYASCEPCPMCVAAIYWAHISRVFYANTTSDAAEIGFDDQAICREVALDPPRRGLPHVRLLGQEAKIVFDEWDEWDGKVRY